MAIADLGVLITLLRSQGVSLAKKLVLEEAKAGWPKLMATPIVGPIASWLIGLVVGRIMTVLSQRAEFALFVQNTVVRVQSQAKDFEAAVDKRDQSKTESELASAEAEALKSFDDLAKFNR